MERRYFFKVSFLFIIIIFCPQYYSYYYSLKILFFKYYYSLNKYSSNSLLLLLLLLIYLLFIIIIIIIDPLGLCAYELARRCLAPLGGQASFHSSLFSHSIATCTCICAGFEHNTIQRIVLTLYCMQCNHAIVSILGAKIR